MMPGLEIREGGRIYHNGEYVPELLLNGKDFFKGDPSVALKNLPAAPSLTGEGGGRGPPTAPICARTQRATPSVGTKPWMCASRRSTTVRGSAMWNWRVAPSLTGEGGGRGSFLLGFTQRSRFSAFGNANNLSNQERTSEDGSWRRDWNRWDSNDGTKRVEYGGLDFNTESRNSKVKLNTSFTARGSLPNRGGRGERLHLLHQLPALGRCVQPLP